MVLDGEYRMVPLCLIKTTRVTTIESLASTMSFSECLSDGWRIVQKKKDKHKRIFHDIEWTRSGFLVVPGDAPACVDVFINGQFLGGQDDWDQMVGKKHTNVTIEWEE